MVLDGVDYAEGTYDGLDFGFDGGAFVIKSISIDPPRFSSPS